MIGPDLHLHNPKPLLNVIQLVSVRFLDLKRELLRFQKLEFKTWILKLKIYNIKF